MEEVSSLSEIDRVTIQRRKKYSLSYVAKAYLQNLSDINSLIDYVFQLGGMGKQAVAELDELLKLSNDNNDLLRANVISAIGRINAMPEKSIPVLKRALFDSNVQVRQYAAAGIGLFSAEELINNEAVYYLVKRAAVEKDPTVYEFLSETLSSIKKHRKE